jgi:hypothetical protein
MQPKPSTRTAQEVAELRAPLQRLQQAVGLVGEEPHTPSPVYPVVDRDGPTMRDRAHISFAALQLSGFTSEKDERESLARQWAAPGRAER